MPLPLPARIAAALFAALPFVALPGSGQTTKLWSVTHQEEMERGTTDGAAIRSDGRIEIGPAVTLLTTTASPYAWAVAPAPHGESYLALGGSSQGSAAILRVHTDGTSSKVFSGTELAVQALHVEPDGTLLFVTSPDGKLYRMRPGSAVEVLFDPAKTVDKPKYLWDLAVRGTTVYVASGAPAAVYKIETAQAAPGNHTPLFKTADQHIRTLLIAPDGTLWAGSDGAGVIYRLDTKDPAAKPFAAYAAPRKEITALALDPAGNLYAAGVGALGPSHLPPLPVTGALGVSVTFLLPGSATAAGSNTLLPEGSELYRIAPDGSPTKLATLKDDVVYALAWRENALLAATGNRGHLYRVEPAATGEGLVTDLAHVEAGQATALASAPDGSLLAATGNGAKLYRIAPGTTSSGTYTSEVFDAKQFSRFGRVETDADSHGFELYLRTGNVPTPLQGWTTWQKVAPNAAPSLPAVGRYAQWKAVLNTNGTLDGVAVNYLPRNLAPVVDEIYVQPGARVVATPTPPSTVVQVQYPAPSPTPTADTLANPLAAQKDRTAVTVRWTSHDDNGDDLLYAVYARGDGETQWRLLKDKITDRYLSFDAALLPDGLYRLKVEASDGPDHTDADTLTASRVSSPFLIDTTPPVPGPLSATFASGHIHVTFQAHDALSPITHAEYSLDAGDWQFLTPVGTLSDALTERYDLTLPAQPGEHTLALRVYDRADNAVSVKTVVH
jgi:hypothetical protein